MEIKSLLNILQDPYADYYIFLKEVVKEKGISFQIPIKMSLTEGILLKVNNRLVKLKSINSLLYFGPFSKTSQIRSLQFPLFPKDLVEIEITLGSVKLKQEGFLEDIHFKMKELDKCLDEVSKLKHIEIFIKVKEFGYLREEEENESKLDNSEHVKNVLLKKISFSITHKDPALLKTVYSYLTNQEIPPDFLVNKSKYILDAVRIRNNLLVSQICLDSLDWYSKKTTVDHIKNHQNSIQTYIRDMMDALKNNSTIIIDPRA